ncbi:hypothetical protein AM405_06825 [Proteus mirabilis]|nr:hypothetical protein AM438_08410 [Proteus mirabilis]ORD12788.1 hypothetical protein A4T38_27565 [Escherichia coli]PLE31257.1 hypothetical protein B6I70_20740 [Klebsiella pneumoniae]ARX10831.1 hypothetical protein AM405_06825 [Proteus mirabilis]ASB02654.1 hypothetical protein AM403_13645 [Proteus mirabilis]
MQNDFNRQCLTVKVINFNSPPGFNRLNYGDDLMLSKTGFTHSDLLRWQINYAGYLHRQPQYAEDEASDRSIV